MPTFYSYFEENGCRIRFISSDNGGRQEHRDVAMNERQAKVVNRLWDGFDDKLTTVKWAKICKTSQATALRDINDLIGKGILVKGEDGSKNTSYILTGDR